MAKKFVLYLGGGAMAGIFGGGIVNFINAFFLILI